jgi:hypothetical protein
MKKYIYINYYRDRDPARRAENLQCVMGNLSLPWLDGMIIFLDDPDHGADIPANDKITFVDISRRMEFRDAIQHANDNLPPDSIFIILNLDIMIEHSVVWSTIDQDFFQTGFPHKAMVCKRHNLAEDGSLWVEEKSWQKGEFCDAYIMTTPVAPGLLQEDLDFCVGNAPQCDNTMMYLMHKYYHVFSWGSKYRIIHVDIVKRGTVKSGAITNATTDYRPSRRKTEHININGYQDWDRLLIEQRQPEYHPTWRLQNVTFTVDIPTI